MRSPVFNLHSQKSQEWCMRCRFTKNCRFKYRASPEILDVSPLITNPDGSCQLYRCDRGKSRNYARPLMH